MRFLWIRGIQMQSLEMFLVHVEDPYAELEGWDRMIRPGLITLCDVSGVMSGDSLRYDVSRRS